jgi:hypothetical protein
MTHEIYNGYEFLVLIVIWAIIYGILEYAQKRKD